MSDSRTIHISDIPALLGNWRAGSGALTVRLARAIEDAVHRGELTENSLLPPERRLADALDLSRSTVVRTLDLLTERGIVRRVQGSGTFVAAPPSKRVAALLPPPLRAYYQARALAAPNFAAAVFPSAQDLPRDALAFGESDLSTIDDPASGYAIPGLPSTRRAVAEALTALRFPTSPDSIIMTTGATQALSIAFDLILRSDDVVVVDAPTYPTTLDMLRRHGVRIVSTRSDAGVVDTSTLARTALRLQAKMVVVISTCNPATGTTIPDTDRVPLVRLAEKGIVVVDDQTLADYHRGTPARPLAVLHDHRNIITVGSYNKVYWGGLRVGWLRCHEAMTESLTWVKAKTDFGGSVPSQVLLRKLLPHHASITALRRRQVRERAASVRDFLAVHLPDWTVEGADQGPSMWIRLPLRDTADFVSYAYRRGISVGYGGMYRSDGGRSSHIRLALTSDLGLIAVGLADLQSAWNAFGPKRR
ncbi:PLP-dependent aminotransferase family protein [Nonomuraea sp. M3C6]|uniref:PLP-dependent aminotransferase family protein n=1 Tax=Nonomuraea marmarensis TaxID=3351344 RepID=A0ABW7AX73_9ACTN